MGNQTSRRPIELGAYVTNAKAEVSQRQEEVHRLHRSLWDLSQQRQVNDAKVEDRRQRLKRALARNVGVCVDDAGLRSWCEVKLSRALLRPGAVLEYLRAVQQHLDGPVQRKKKVYDPVLSQAERHNMQVLHDVVATMLFKAEPLVLDVDPPHEAQGSTFRSDEGSTFRYRVPADKVPGQVVTIVQKDPDGFTHTIPYTVVTPGIEVELHYPLDTFYACQHRRRTVTRQALDREPVVGQPVRIGPYEGVVKSVDGDTVQVELNEKYFLSCFLFKYQQRLKELPLPTTQRKGRQYVRDLQAIVEDFNDAFYRKWKSWQTVWDNPKWQWASKFVLGMALYYIMLYVVIPSIATTGFAKAVAQTTTPCLGTIAQTMVPDLLSRAVNVDRVVTVLQEKGLMPLAARLQKKSNTVEAIVNDLASVANVSSEEAQTMLVGRYNVVVGYLQSLAVNGTLSMVGVPFVQIC